MGDKELNGIISSQKKYISEQIMASSLDEAAGDKINGYEEININGRICRVSIEKI